MLPAFLGYWRERYVFFHIPPIHVFFLFIPNHRCFEAGWQSIKKREGARPPWLPVLSGWMQHTWGPSTYVAQRCMLSSCSHISTPASVSTLASESTSAPVVSTSLQEHQNRTFKEVGTVMCYVGDFDMCFPHLDRVDISCKCFVGEDSR